MANRYLVVMSICGLLSLSLSSRAMDFNEEEYADHCQQENKRYGHIACASACGGVSCCFLGLPANSVVCPGIGLGLLCLAKHFYKQRFVPCKDAVEAGNYLSLAANRGEMELLSDEQLAQANRELRAAEHIFTYRAQGRGGNDTDRKNADQCLRLRKVRESEESYRAACLVDEYNW